MKTTSAAISAFMSILAGLMLPFISCHYENMANFYVTCNSTGLTVDVTFEKPFSGIAFAAGYFFDHHCSVPATSDSTDLTLSIFLPSNACGTRILEKGGNLWMASRVVFQQHRMLKTTWDIEEEFVCKLPQSVTRQSLPSPSLHYPKEGLHGWIDVDLGSEVVGEQVSRENVGDLMLAIYAKDNENNNFLKVQDCVAHNEEVITENTEMVQMYNAYNCRRQYLLSEFNVTKIKTPESDFKAFATFKAFRIASKGRLQITCAVQACKTECPDYCGNPNRYYTSGIISRSLLKRSIGTSTTSPDVKSLDTRHILMKATISALMKRLLKVTRPKVSENTALFEKRLLNSPVTSTSKYAGETTEINDENDHTLENGSGAIEQTSQFGILSFDPTGVSTLEELQGNVDSTSLNFVVVSEVLNAVITTPTIDTLSSFPSTSDKDMNLPYDVSEFNVTKNTTALSEKNFKSFDDDISNSEHSDGKCVPKLRFAMITGVLSFILFCLILTCIALTVRMRKEKKKHLIDTFLLYNFY